MDKRDAFTPRGGNGRQQPRPGGRPGGQGGPRDKGPVRLAHDRGRAFQQLFAAGGRAPTEARLARDLPAFSLYLNYAVDNLKVLGGLKSDDEAKVKAELAQKSDAEVAKLADFLWTFQCDRPERDFPDWRPLAEALVVRVFALRNYFVHRARPGIGPLLAGREMYVLLEGLLFPLARGEALAPGRKTEKLFKLKLMNLHDKGKELYEFTRKGLIFLTCLALYKDDAEEFCHALDDMKSLEREDAGGAPAPAANPGQRGRARSLCEALTYFSYRRGRSSMALDDLDFMCFADVLGYLNKAPAVACDCLALGAERERLQKLCEQSTESEDNKKFKYALHKRFRERFLPFAAAYCEDFGVFPSLRFKRLDVAPRVGRQRYAFGAEADNRNRLDRHYAIAKGRLGLEWRPAAHHGEVRITALRGSVGAGELKRALFAATEYLSGDKDRGAADAAVAAYFAAYHRILETALNCPDPATLDRAQSPFLEDFATVAGCSPDDVRSERFAQIMAPYFPANFLRFFTGEDGRLDCATMQARLCERFQVLANHAQDFLTRAARLEEWRRQDPASRPPSPRCAPGELSYPPPSCRFSDGALISQVFQWLNLWLKPEERFRQLPRAEQHRGAEDHQYQLVHAAIGRFALDQQGLWGALAKFRPGLKDPVDDLRRRVEDKYHQEIGYLKTHPRYDQLGRPARAARTLLMLAQAAAELCRAEYLKGLRAFRQYTPDDGDAKLVRGFAATCRRLGIRVGLPRDRAALVKTVLGIDEEKWRHAYDYAHHCPYAGRSLADGGHVVAQVPFPRDFAQRLLREKIAQWQGQKGNPAAAFVVDGVFDFNRAFAAKAAERAVLRDFYDVSPLVAAFKALKRGGDWRAVPGINPESPVFASPAAVDKAIRALKDARNEDVLLLRLALDYRARYENPGAAMGAGRAAAKKYQSVYDFYGAEARPLQVGGVNLTLSPNDRFRPAFAQVCKYAPVLARRLAPGGGPKEFAFYDLMMAFRRLQAEDRRKRLEIIPLLERFEARVDLPPHEEYSGKSKEQIREMELRCYAAAYPKMDAVDYDVLAKARNDVYHDGLGLDTAEALRTLRELLP